MQSGELACGMFCTHNPKLIPLSAQENAWNSGCITYLKKSEAAFEA